MGYIVLFIYLLFLSALRVTNGKVFSPCELVREIEEEKTLNPEYLDFDYEKHISLVVCIAGFSGYDTSYQLTHPNGTGYYGIFRIHSSDFEKCFKRGDPRGPNADISGLTNHVLYGDLRCLAHVVLVSQATLDFYEKLCSPPFVKKVSCRLNNYAVTTVFEPIQKDILERTFGTNDDPFLLLTHPPNMASKVTTIAYTRPSKTSKKPSDSIMTSVSHPSDRSFYRKSTTSTPSTVSPRSARLETPHNPQDSNPHHLAERFTVFTCICVLLAILGFMSLKLIKFSKMYREWNRTHQGRKFHYDVGSSASSAVLD